MTKHRRLENTELSQLRSEMNINFGSGNSNNYQINIQNDVQLDLDNF